MPKSTKTLIALSGGGTGGHVFPLLAVADEIIGKNPDTKFIYYGSGAGAEQHIKIRKDVLYRKIICGKFRRNFSVGAFFNNIVDLVKLKIGFFQSLYYLILDKPQIIFSKGGYVSLPLVWAAGVLGIPIIVHESDVVPGLANRFAFRFAAKIGVAFELACYDLAVQAKAFYCGVPLRKEFNDIWKDKTKEGEYILVIGGSLGAVSLNSQIFEIAPELLSHHKIVHLTGKFDFKRSEDFKKSLTQAQQKNYSNIDFSDDPAGLMSNAKLVVSRCGATAIFEVAASRKPAIFVPIAKEVTSHQLINAAYLKTKDLAEIHLPNDDSAKLYRKISKLLQNKNSHDLQKIFFPMSANLIARLIIDEIEKQEFAKIKNIFLIGIQGVSMKGIAKILEKMGKRVAGSDLKLGGHKKENIAEDTELVIYSSAADKSSGAEVEHIRARELKIPTIKRSQAINLLMRGFDGISISGMHGKTTITALCAMIFQNAGFDPSYLIGADYVAEEPPAKWGRGRVFIAEACEYDGSFLDFPTKVAVISNIEKEHLDYFKGGLAEIKGQFRQFINNIYPGGVVVFCGDDKNTFEVVGGVAGDLEEKRVKMVSFGFKPTNDYVVLNYKIIDGRVSFEVKNKNVRIPIETVLPGKHFALNCAAALAVADQYQIEPTVSSLSISGFTGTSRRFERIGEKNGVIVLDDYAHHPSEVTATLSALNELYPDKRKIIIFGPHQQSRFNEFYKDFVTAFKNSKIDALAIMPVYRVPGRDIAPKFSSDDLSKELSEAKEIETVALKSYDEAVKYLNTVARKDDVVMTMGATDVWRVGEEYLKD